MIFMYINLIIDLYAEFLDFYAKIKIMTMNVIPPRLAEIATRKIFASESIIRIIQWPELPKYSALIDIE